MKFIHSLVAVLVVSLFVAGAQAETLIRSQTFWGDLCATDGDETDHLDDCATIPGNVGIVGVYELMLYGLDPNPQGDAIVRITAPYADLYGGVGLNNSNERFRLFLDGTDYGLLFDGSEEDEAQSSPTLAASVRRNIVAATGSASTLDLIFTMPAEELAPMVADGVLSVRFDFREDENVNGLDDLTVLLSYVAAPPVQAHPLAGADLARLTAALTAQTSAIEHLAQAIRAMNEAAH